MLEAMKQTFADPLIIWGKVAAFLPSLLTALVLLVGGHFIAKLLASGVAKLLAKVGIDRLAETAGIHGAIKKAGVSATPSRILSKILYWLVFLTFIVSASDALGLDRISAMIDLFVLYIPKILSAVILTMVGLFIAGLVRTGIEASLGSLNLGYERTIGGIIYALIVVIVVSLAINQLEIETELLNQVVIIFLMAGAGAVALALGLGTKHVAGNIVAGVYARELYLPGSRIKVGVLTGEVVEIGSTALIIKTDENKKITIPNSVLIDTQVEILSD